MGPWNKFDGLRLIRRRRLVVDLAIRSLSGVLIGVRFLGDLTGHVHFSAVDLVPARRHTFGWHCSTAQMAHVVDGFSLGQAMSQLDQGPFSIAVQQDVSFGIE